MTSTPSRPVLLEPSPWRPRSALYSGLKRKCTRVLWRSLDSMTTSPPLPPSPPEGPPRGTNFSRRKAMQPLPPSPALTLIFASSINMRVLYLYHQGTQRECLTDFERDFLQPGQPAALEFRPDGLGGIECVLKSLTRFFGPLQPPQDVAQLRLRLNRPRRESDRGLRFGKRLIQMVVLHRQLRTRDVVQRRSQRDLEVSVEDKQSIFNRGRR